jgi:hypothetical protein
MGLEICPDMYNVRVRTSVDQRDGVMEDGSTIFTILIVCP